MPLDQRRKRIIDSKMSGPPQQKNGAADLKRATPHFHQNIIDADFCGDNATVRDP